MFYPTQQEGSFMRRQNYLHSAPEWLDSQAPVSSDSLFNGYEVQSKEWMVLPLAVGLEGTLKPLLDDLCPTIE